MVAENNEVCFIFITSPKYYLRPLSLSYYFIFIPFKKNRLLKAAIKMNT